VEDPNDNLAEQTVLEQTASTRLLTTAEKYRRTELRKALLLWITNGGKEPRWADYPDASQSYLAWLRLSVAERQLCGEASRPPQRFRLL
jgi:hypothetical protein